MLGSDIIGMPKVMIFRRFLSGTAVRMAVVVPIAKTGEFEK